MSDAEIIRLKPRRTVGFRWVVFAVVASGLLSFFVGTVYAQKGSAQTVEIGRAVTIERTVATIPVVQTTSTTAKAETCREAIRAVFPPALQRDALLVLSKENGPEDRYAKSTPNADGTRDWGCMQINSIHLGTKGWWTHESIFDPQVNAAVALAIYNERGNWSAWYSVCPLQGEQLLRCR